MPSSGAMRLVCAAGLILTLSACEGVKKQLGLAKESPDEFRVVSHAPLTLPPDFTLRPPEPGAVRPQEGTTAQQARQAVFGTDPAKTPAPQPVAASEGLSAGERSFLKAAGADGINPDLRTLIDREAETARNDTDFMETLVFWRAAQPPGTVVDAEAEARRLRENSALGKDITEGETPSIERRKKAIFEGLF